MGWTDSDGDMIEAAMGLICNASDFKSAGIRWEGGTPIALPPSDSPDSVEWRAAADAWIARYHRRIKA
jgi:hypothetical protein